MATQNAPTVDEPAHLAAGVSYWSYGTFNLYPVNPPLAKLFASAPAFLLDARVNWKRVDLRAGVRSEWLVGTDFVEANAEQIFLLVAMGRCCSALISLFGGACCYLWARDLYGTPSGILALALWSFCPTVLGYAGIIGSDTAAAACGVIACYVFWIWTRMYQMHAALVAGCALGLAELAKLSWIPLFAVLPGVWFLFAFWRRSSLSVAKAVSQLATILVTGACVINFGYGFEGTGKMLSDYEFVSQTLAGIPSSRDSMVSGNRLRECWAGRCPMLLPAPYVTGIDLQLRDLESRKGCYINGRFLKEGCWYYYPYALAVKTPLGTSVLFWVSAFLFAFDRRYRSSWRSEILLFIAPITLMIILAANSKGVCHYRYVVPCLPFCFIHTSRLARAASLGHLGTVLILFMSFAFALVSTLSVFPHSLSYFNELAGGPSLGHRHISGSAIDLGQDLFRLKDWLDEHPEVAPLYLTYVGSIRPSAVGIECSRVPKFGRHATTTINGEKSEWCWYAVSVSRLHTPFGEYDYLLREEPFAIAGSSIYIYRLQAP